MGNFERLEVWRGARALNFAIYQATKAFPNDERFGLVSQMRRASVSISSNIAEGAGRGGSNEFRAFIRIARGSTQELISQLYLAMDLELIEPEAATTHIASANRIGRMLSGLLRG
jgi:four helix bundle protein